MEKNDIQKNNIENAEKNNIEKSKKYMLSAVLGFVFTFAIALMMTYMADYLPDTQATKILMPTNGSVWESLKLMFWPSLLFFALQFIIFGHQDADHLPMVAMSLTVGIISTLAFYYISKGAVGIETSYTALLFGTATMFISSYLLMRDGKLTQNAAIVAGGMLYADLIAMFVAFTFYAPELNLFIY